MTDEFYMRLAYQEAKNAYAQGEVPIGAVIVGAGRILAKAYNQTELLADPTAHAEIIAITSACNTIGAKYLTDCTIYVTVEPCAMCAGAIFWAQLSRLVFGAYEPKSGFYTKSMPILLDKTIVTAGILEIECSELMKAFFKEKRK